jgi:hypothetical protein
MMIELREAYLQAYIARLRSLFGGAGVELPQVRCSCSFAYRGGARALGQCWPGALAADGVVQIKISPLIDNAVEVGGILVHELVHAARPGAKHGPQFRELALAVGLTGRMTATAPSPGLEDRLRTIVAELGIYPHARLMPRERGPVLTGFVPTVEDEPPKQTTRLIRVACPECEYPARITRKWLQRLGPPSCPCGRQMRVDDPTNELATLLGGGARQEATS